jgi:glutamine amidotransferase
MSCRAPATVSVSLDEFTRHGGLTGPHKDGWGMAFYEGRDIHRLREDRPASESRAVAFVAEQQYRSTCVLGHIRQATFGAVGLQNTQPFARELGGRMHVFAHNGDLPGVADRYRQGRGCFRTIGESDSEQAFCLLLAEMQALWDGDEVPSLEARTAVVAGFARGLRPLGPANFLYADGDVLFVHGHKRSQTVPEDIRPPGLHYLCRTCRAKKAGPRLIQGLAIGFSAPVQEVVLVASVPLSGEPWQPLEEGEILVLQRGRVVRRVSADGEAGEPVAPPAGDDSAPQADLSTGGGKRSA